MKIERCPQGHFFDGDRYDVCPLCPPDPAPEPFRPTVGWLVCLEEPFQGLDFRLHEGMNLLGSQIPIPGVQAPTALICYDGKTGLFTFGSTHGGQAAVNGQPLSTPMVLRPGDRLTVGDAALLFVPLDPNSIVSSH